MSDSVKSSRKKRVKNSLFGVALPRWLSSLARAVRWASEAGARAQPAGSEWKVRKRRTAEHTALLRIGALRGGTERMMTPVGCGLLYVFLNGRYLCKVESKCVGSKEEEAGDIQERRSMVYGKLPESEMRGPVGPVLYCSRRKAYGCVHI